MQISKVDHTRVGVSATQDGISGIIYKNPAKAGEEPGDVSGRSGQRIKDANRLYSPISPIPPQMKKITVDGRPEKRDGESQEKFDKRVEKYDEAKAMDSIHRVVSECFGKGLWREQNLKEKLKERLKEGRIVPVKEGYIDLFAYKFLKKALRRNEKVVESFTSILNVLVGGSELKSVSDSEIEIFCDAVKKDLSRQSQDKIAQSIRNQDMVTQVSGDSLKISGENKKREEKKHKEYKGLDKKALNKFLSVYADLHEKNRMNYLRSLSRIVVLYFYGIDSVPIGEFDVWEDHEKRKLVDSDFIEIPDVLKNAEEREKLEKPSLTKHLEELTKNIRKKNIDCYMKSVKAVEADDSGLFFEDKDISEFWIRHIESLVEKQYSNFNLGKLFQLKKGFLSEKAWKDALNFLCIKYISIGKAVYQFALDDVYKDEGQRKPGVLPEKLKYGINSFDYEMIKAKETVQRETAVYACFAIDSFSRATINKSEGYEDFLLLKEKGHKEENSKTKEEITVYGITELKKDNAIRNVMQFFGGRSNWKDFDFSKFQGTEGEVRLIMEFKKILYAIRNESFHFTTSKRDDDWDGAFVAGLFEHDMKSVSKVIRGQFYSNNLAVYYPQKDLERVLNRLYAEYHERMSQVPAFRTVFVRKKFSSFLSETLRIGNNNNFSGEERKKWESALYFLMKEIYYNAFLSDDRARDYFLEAVEEKSFGKSGNRNDNFAVNSFKGRIDRIKDYSLSEICQFIMTDQNQQNQGHKKVQSTKGGKATENKFKHFSLLLYEALRKAFARYLDLSNPESLYLFIKKKPGLAEISEEGFLSTWECTAYKKLSNEVANDKYRQQWYILGRLLAPKQLNLLNGAIRSCIQYESDISRRAEENGNELHVDDDKQYYSSIVEILDFCTRLSGRFSNEISDYFDDEDDYTCLIGKYLNYEEGQDKTEGVTLSETEKLKAFCEQEVPGNKDRTLGEFYFKTNPILNRNIVMAKIYGNDDIVSSALGKVSKEDLLSFFKSEAEINSYIQKGRCDTDKEQKDLIIYQSQRNRIELQDIYSLSELVSELQGQLVNWVFMRERDLMYFQLGFHYYSLGNDAEKPAAYKRLTFSDGGVIDNAILYQIAALYNFGLELYDKINNSGEVDEKLQKKSNHKKAGTSAKIGAFISFGERAGLNGEELYNSGLELFENVKEHDDIIDLRNYIEHFHYYTRKDRSLLDQYSEVFDRFFTYDKSYRKGVPVVLQNILLRRFILLNLSFKTGQKKIGNQEKKSARLQINERGLASDLLTYELGGGDRIIQLPAKDRRFMENICAILYYPEQIPTGIVNEEMYERDMEAKSKNEHKHKSGKDNSRRKGTSKNKRK